MHIQQQPAYIIHHHDYRETSLLVELFTRDYGRVGVIAKGARRPGSGKRALLNPFSPLLLSWSGRGELGVITEVEANGTPLMLTGEAVYCGFYANELILRLLHRHDAHEALFEGYQRCLQTLQIDQVNDTALRMFEVLMLQEIGYGLVLDHDTVDNMPIQPDFTYEYIADNGPRHLNVGEVVRSGVEIHGTTLLALAAGDISEAETLGELKLLMRYVLNRHLGNRPLNSRKLMQSVRHHLPSEPGRHQG
ncbi:MAG: DNA repair protein RecO [Acidiferrobacterales bacterium]